MHKYSIGQLVYFDGPFHGNAARGRYEVVRMLPVENDNKTLYRIKSPAEAFERTADEDQLTLATA